MAPEPVQRTVIIALAMLGLTSGIVMQSSSTPASVRRAPAAPPLVVERTRCLQPAAAAHRARQLLASVDARLERASLVLGDGPAALADLSEATLCLRTAGAPAAADQLATRLAHLRATLEDDYRARQLRVRLALETRHLESVPRESRQLLELLGARGGEYTAWLKGLAAEAGP